MEDGAPELAGEVGGDDDGALLVSPADDVEEEIGDAAVAGDVPELVEDEELGRGVAPEPSLGGSTLLSARSARTSGFCDQDSTRPAMSLVSRSTALCSTAWT